MDSQKARQAGQIVMKLIAKKGLKDLTHYGLPVLVGMLPLLGDTADVVDGIQEIISLFSDDNHLA